MYNAVTIDVEDYFQVAALAKWAPTDSWDEHPSRVEENTEKALALMDERGIKGTFFILGWVAERQPQLVKKIHELGHEVASHGYSHQLVYNQSQEVFRSETERSKKLLEDIIGEEILGYRAASYSITKESLWALDILAECGFKYDSSIFPVRHDRYGIPDAIDVPHKLRSPSGYELTEFPITTLKIFNYRLPVAGGGYFRLFPYGFSKWALKRVNQVQKQSFVFYLHPWELDPEQPKFPATGLSKFRHYNNLDVCSERFEKLLDAFEFTTVESILKKQSLLDA